MFLDLRLQILGPAKFPTNDSLMCLTVYADRISL